MIANLRHQNTDVDANRPGGAGEQRSSDAADLRLRTPEALAVHIPLVGEASKRHPKS